MKCLIIASFIAVAFARPEPPTSYGAPPAYSPPVREYGPPPPAPVPEYGVPVESGKVYRHVYVHAAPDEATDYQSRVIRVPGGQDKHVNIIFVKTPSSSSQQQTEVILPEQNEQKTLVYVLLKKGENNADVKIRAPAERPQQKPEVFFIRYKNKEQQGGYGPPPTVTETYGPPPPQVKETYGPPPPSQGY